MIYIFTPDGQIVDINPAGLKLLGFNSKDETAQRNIREFHVDSKAGESLVKEILEKGEVTKYRITKYRILFQNVKGDKFEIGLKAIAQRDEIGFFLNQVSIAVEDVTKRLKKIKEQYWNLQTVSDGSGGIIYQRHQKAIQASVKLCAPDK